MRFSAERTQLEEALDLAARRVDGGFEVERRRLLHRYEDIERSFAELERTLQELNDGLPFSAVGNPLERQVLGAIERHLYWLRELRGTVESLSSTSVAEPVRALLTDAQLGEL